jgi:hypothetical protein
MLTCKRFTNLFTGREAVPPARAPGPRGNFLFGSALDFKRDPLSHVVKCREQFGDMVRYRISLTCSANFGSWSNRVLHGSVPSPEGWNESSENRPNGTARDEEPLSRYAS